MRYRKREGLLLFAALVFLLGSASACGTPSAFVRFDCSENINNNRRLSVDLIWANEVEERMILQTGPDEWWVSDYRESMSSKITSEILEGGCESKTLNISGREGDMSLIIFADYMGVDSREAQQIVIPAGSEVTIVAYPDRLGCVKGCEE